MSHSETLGTLYVSKEHHSHGMTHADSDACCVKQVPKKCDPCPPKRCDPCVQEVPKKCDPCPDPCADPCDPCATKCDPCGSGFWTFLIIFIIVAIVVALILWAICPDFIKKKDSAGNVTDEVDVGKLILWSVVIALVVAFLIWLIWSCCC